MAEKRSGRAQGVPHHPLVEALASDPNQPPKQATRLFGFPGPAAARSSTRLWLDLDLTSYVDVPDDAILHSRTLPEEEGTILWVDPTATLTHSVPAQQEVQAEFLAGSIAAGNLAGAPAAAAPPQGTGTGRPPSGIRCDHSLFFVCPSEMRLCNETWYPCNPFTVEWPEAQARLQRPAQSVGIVCQSLVVRCPTRPAECVRFQSQVHPCVTQQQICQSQTFPCIAASGGGFACPPEPWTGTTPVWTATTPATDPVGPFRPQQ